MKRLLSMMCMYIACIGYTIADEIVVPNVIIPKGGKATLDIQLNNEQVLSPNFEFYLRLPDGITVVRDSEKLGGRFNGTGVTVSCTPNEGRYWILAMLLPPGNAPIPEESGTIVTLDLLADDSLEEGVTLNASIEDITFNTWFVDKSGVNAGLPSPVNFTITIKEPTDGRTVLDENSTSAPAAANGVDVRVLRTIKADEWSTICLPFTATGEQVKAAFGEDVQLATFTAWKSEEDNDGAIVGINVTFTSANAEDGIEANTPMLIKVSDAVTEATFDGVTLEPTEEPVVQVGKKASERGRFYGTYAVMQVPEENLFLSGNKFWYSTGATTIKGYRGYFWFRDVLDAYYDGTEVKINFFLDDEETCVEGVNVGQQTSDAIYDLGGRKVAKPQQHGVYIINGKKILK